MVLHQFEWFRSLFTRYPPATDVFSFMQREAAISRNLRAFVLVALVALIVTMFVIAVTNHADVIETMNQTIDTNSPTIRAEIALLGNLLSPVRLALLLQYPNLYWFLGYNNKLTGPILAAIMKLETPAPQRIVRVLGLLEGGIIVSPTTNPPTLLQEIIQQVFPQDTFKSTLQLPQMQVTPSELETTMGLLNQVMQFSMFFMML